MVKKTNNAMVKKKNNTMVKKTNTYFWQYNSSSGQYICWNTHWIFTSA
jgi:hypothetical protein